MTSATGSELELQKKKKVKHGGEGLRDGVGEGTGWMEGEKELIYALRPPVWVDKAQDPWRGSRYLPGVMLESQSSLLEACPSQEHPNWKELGMFRDL